MVNVKEKFSFGSFEICEDLGVWLHVKGKTEIS